MLKQIKKVFNQSIIMSSVFIFIGVLLFIFPNTTISFISSGLGIIIGISGIIALLNVFIHNKTINKLDIVYGVLMLLLSIFLIMNPKMIASVLPLVIGVWVIVNGVFKLQYAFKLKKYEKKWLSVLIIAFIMIGLGIVLVFNPFSGALIMTQIIGIFILIYSILEIVEVIIIKKGKNDVIDIIDIK